MIILTIIACIMMYIQAKKLITRNVKLDLGVKIVLLSDLHFDIKLVNHDKIVEKVNEAKPEVIVITGDLCSNIKYFYRVETFLKSLSEKNKCQILVTLGNHDNKIFFKKDYNKQKYIEKIEKSAPNVRVLENNFFVYNNVIFGGLGDVKTNKEDCNELTRKWHKEAMQKDYKFILLTHNPDIVLKIDEINSPDIILAGHTHGGQMKMPFNIEFTVLKKDILPKKKIYYGLHTFEGKKMYITSGIGCSGLPFRLKSSAEIVSIS